MRRVVVFLLVGLVAVGIVTAAGSGESGSGETGGTDSVENFVFSYSDTAADGKPQIVFAEKFAELVAEKTDGSVQIEVYPGGTLAGYSLEPVQTGIADMVQVTAGVAAPLVRWVSVLDAPYLIETGEHFHTVTDARGELVTAANEELADDNLVLLGFYNYGTRDLTAEEPIYTLDDLNGLKMRVVPSVAFRVTWETFGAAATPMPSSEMVTAMLTGVVDAQENSWHDIVGFALWDVQGYIMRTNHLATAAGIWMNRNRFESMSESQQEAVRDAINEASEWFSYEYTVEKLSEYTEIIEGNGMEIIGPEDGLDIAAFRERARDVYVYFQEDWGEWVDRIESMK